MAGVGKGRISKGMDFVIGVTRSTTNYVGNGKINSRMTYITYTAD